MIGERFEKENGRAETQGAGGELLCASAPPRDELFSYKPAVVDPVFLIGAINAILDCSDAPELKLKRVQMAMSVFFRQQDQVLERVLAAQWPVD